MIPSLLMKEISTCHHKYATIDIWGQIFPVVQRAVLCITECSGHIPGPTL